MGTNYYAYTDTCPHCGRGDERIHIGKQSGGWTFGWHGISGVMDGVELRSCADWYEFLARDGVSIADEYGHSVTLEEFREMVDAQRNARRNHALEYPDRCWVDADGCGFSSGEFS